MYYSLAELQAADEVTSKRPQFGGVENHPENLHSENGYPLLNVYISMRKYNFSCQDIHYFDWAMFNSSQ